jgi:uncharacterized membrane protein YeiH
MTTAVSSSRLLNAVDLAGTFVFAAEGALAAIAANLDYLGIMVLSFATALAGGLIRDLMIGALPPASIRNWRYAAVAFTAGALVILLYDLVQKVPGSVIVILDAGGLALFAVAGTEKALAYKISPFIAVLLGTTTGVGGGTVRDILLAQIPIVLRADVYATAAMAGSAVMVVALRLRVPRALAATLGGGVCFVLRMVSVWRHWNLPKVTGP